MTGIVLNNISDAYIGNNQVSEIWLGQNKIWPATQHDYSQDPLTFEVLEDGQFKFNYNTNNTSPMRYSLDNGTTWVTMQDDTWTATIPAGSKMIFDCYEPAPLKPPYAPVGIGTFSSTGNFNVSGNIGSILEGYMGMNQTYFSLDDCQFGFLFNNCTHLISAEHLYLPTDTIIYACYFDMFSGCTSLIKAPALPATTLANSCYHSMFYGCTSLIKAPELPATSLAPKCYHSMFGGCSSLTTAPALPATTLTSACYEAMFEGCTSLTTAPALPATTLAEFCYSNMFNSCFPLTTAPALPATTLARWCYASMFVYCHNLTTSPVLPASTLVEGCYADMFVDCNNLNSITCLATNRSATDCTTGWVEGVSTTGTFTRAASMNYWPSGDDGIPSRWTVVNAPNT